MEQTPETRPSLLERIRDPSDTVAWQDFVTLYAPLIYAYGRRRGLQDADAADVSQAVFQSIAQAISGFRYDATRGRFRSWLFTVTRNQVSKMLLKKAQLPISGDKEHARFEEQIDSATERERWDREHEQHLFHWAAAKARDEFQEKTWLAFRMVAVDGKSVAETSESLGMTPGAIYIAKSRVTSRLRQMIQSVEEMEPKRQSVL